LPRGSKHRKKLREHDERLKLHLFAGVYGQVKEHKLKWGTGDETDIDELK